MSQPMTPRVHVAALFVAGCLAACGAPSEPDPRAVPPAETVAGGSGGATASTAPSPAVTTAALPRPARIAAKASPAIEECIERNIHDKEYDAMNPRDARRKLRRLQVLADCEQQLASR